MSTPFAIFLAWWFTSLVPTDQTAQAAARAALTGHVEVRAPAADPPPAMSPYARRRSVPPQDPGTPGGAEDAFVYLERTDGSPVPGGAAAPMRIGQRDRTITPHVSAVEVGQLVEFPNDDDVFHNIFSLSAGNSFALGRYAPGTTRQNRFERPGVVRLFCDIHAEMAGVILVVDTPYLTRVQADGAYELLDVAPGSYRAIAWHPTAGTDTMMVTIPGDGVTLDFVLGRGS
jgi:plastocyanin